MPRTPRGRTKVSELGVGTAPRGKGPAPLTIELQEIGRAFVNPFHRWEARVQDPPKHWPREACSAWADRKGEAVSKLMAALEKLLHRAPRYVVVDLPRMLPKVGNLP